MFLTDKNIIFLSEVDSTNNYAKQLVAEKAAPGTVVLAQYQQNGRGQVGNFWESEAGKNLLFSLILYPAFLEAGKQFYISKVVSLALVEVLSEYLDDVKIKWPNDIYVGEKKIAGILIENTIKGISLDSSIVGVGMNINQEKFVSNAPNPISMKLLLGKEFSNKTILNSFLEKLDEFMTFLIEGNFAAIDRSYLAKLFRGDGWHTFRTAGKEFSAKIIGIGNFGQLRLEESGGNITEYMFKEVEFVI